MYKIKYFFPGTNVLGKPLPSLILILDVREFLLKSFILLIL